MKTRWEAIVSGDIRIPASEHLGFVTDPGPSPEGSVSISWVVPEELCNAAGNLQGGVLAALLDAALGGATSVFLDPGTYPALAEMKVSFFRPAPAGMHLTASGRVLKKGARVFFAEAEVHDPAGNLIAKASGTEIPAPA